MRPDHTSDRGNAVLEFVIMAVAVFMPLTYIVIALATVHAANMAASQAAREATRAFTMAAAPTQAAARAEAAARLAMANHGITLAPGMLRLACSGQCLAPGTEIQATVAWSLTLPWLPEMLKGPVTIPVTATHVAVIDSYRGSVG